MDERRVATARPGRRKTPGVGRKILIRLESLFNRKREGEGERGSLDFSSARRIVRILRDESFGSHSRVARSKGKRVSIGNQGEVVGDEMAITINFNLKNRTARRIRERCVVGCGLITKLSVANVS